MSKIYLNPGCALSLYKPEFENIVLDLLNASYGKGEIKPHKICCRYNPRLEDGALIINVCSGCDRRFCSLYYGISTISIWEVIDELEDKFEYPDHSGLILSVHDACPTREKPRVHQAVRNLLRKMNIEVVEAELHGTSSFCCGDSFYPKHPLEEIHRKMKERAESMPSKDVCVYCVSCIKSMHIGGKTPRYLLDLLLNEPTDPQLYDTEKWHELLKDYQKKHKD